MQFFIKRSGSFEWRISARVAANLGQASADRLLADIRIGRADAVLMLGLWLLSKISPRLSATYYFFDFAGKFPRRKDVELVTRRRLRARLDEAIAAGVVDWIEPAFMDKPNPPALPPANAAYAQERLEPPMVAWDGLVLVPTEWRRIRHLKGQIHPQETYCLNSNFVEATLPIILRQGATLRYGLMKTHPTLEALLNKDVDRCLGYVKEALQHQHRETARLYRKSFEDLSQDLTGDVQLQTSTLHLAFSLIRLRHVSREVRYRTLDENAKMR